jgi:hypothetical protein
MSVEEKKHCLETVFEELIVNIFAKSKRTSIHKLKKNTINTSRVSI